MRIEKMIDIIHPAVLEALDTTYTQIKTPSHNVSDLMNRIKLIAYLRGKNYSLKVIGEQVNRDHSTVIHSLQTHSDTLETNREYLERYRYFSNYADRLLRAYETEQLNSIKILGETNEQD